MTEQERQALAWALDLSVHHLLSHPSDESNLSLAIELLKAIRDDPDYIPTLFQRWELEPNAAFDEQTRLAAIPR